MNTRNLRIGLIFLTLCSVILLGCPESGVSSDQIAQGESGDRGDDQTPDSETTPEPTTPEPTTPEPTTPEPTTPEPTTPEPTTPEPTIPEPTTPEPTIPEPTTPEPTIPEPTTPEPTIPTPEPTIPEPTTPEPTIPTPEPIIPDWDTPYHDAIFKATHDSYAESIPAQLDAGFRLIEIDFHDDDHGKYGYRVGHTAPGTEIFLGSGNPGSGGYRLWSIPTTDAFKLPTWLSTLSSWSQNNPGHAPITLILEPKDSLVDNNGYDAHDLSRFNQELLDAFGLDNIYTAFEQGPSNHWPSVDDLRDKFIIVMVGNEDNRHSYVRTLGKTPAVAVNDHGQAIAVYQKPNSRELWYWTGEWQTANSGNKMPAGSILWLRNQRYAEGYDTDSPPTVAINNEGWIVATHEGANQAIEYRLGKLTSELDIDWKAGATSVEAGSNPAIRFDSLDSNAVTTRYTGVDSDTTIYEQAITLHVERSALEPSAATSLSTDTNEWWENKNSAVSQAGIVEVNSNENKGNLLTYTADGRTGRIRLFQLAFIEVEPSEINSDLLYAELYTETTGRFYSAGKFPYLEFFNPRANFDSTVEHRTDTNGNPFLITRYRDFEEVNAREINDPSALPNFPTLRHPRNYQAQWYADMFNRIQHFE